MNDIFLLCAVGRFGRQLAKRRQYAKPLQSVKDKGRRKRFAFFVSKGITEPHRFTCPCQRCVYCELFMKGVSHGTGCQLEAAVSKKLSFRIA